MGLGQILLKKFHDHILNSGPARPDGDAGVMTCNHRHSNGSAFDEGVVMSVRRAARVEPKDPDVVYSSRRSNGYCNGTRCASFQNPLTDLRILKTDSLCINS